MSSRREVTLDYLLPVSVRLDLTSGKIEYMLLSAEDLGLPNQVFTGMLQAEGEEIDEYVPLEHPVAVEALKLVEDIKPSIGEVFLPFDRVDAQGNPLSVPTFGSSIDDDDAAQTMVNDAKHAQDLYDEGARARLLAERELAAAAREVELTSLADTPITPGPLSRESGLAQSHDSGISS